MSVAVTEKAVSQVKQIISEQGYSEETMLRVGVAGGGCSGFSYSLTFDDKYDEKADDVHEFFGLKVCVDKKSDLYLTGTTVDFYEGLEKRGFVFNNPNAVRTCGCGSSFST
jgi:iron-sulfur cluster assembly protein